MDFGALPPEINSGRIYSGPGLAPMLAAASAWDGLAAELQSTAASYAAVTSDLTDTLWHGPASASMSAAAAPYVAWLSSTAAEAQEAALQARAAAGAYEAAFAASVPPPVIAANRALLASLIATNILGQNTPAIGATEAHYAEMWAQDAVAMFGYAGSSAAAAQLTPFTAPPPTTNAGGQDAQSAAVSAAAQSSAASQGQAALSDLITQLPNTLQSLTSNAAAATVAPSTGLGSGLGDLNTIVKLITSFFTTINSPYTPLGIGNLAKNWWQVSISIPALGTAIQSIGPTITPKAVTGVLTPLLSSELLTGAHAAPSGGLGAVTGAAGRAGLIGSLSVPQNWAAAAPAIRMVAAEMPATVLEAAPAMAVNAPSSLFGEMAASSLAGRAFGGTATRVVTGHAPSVAVTAAAKERATTATIIVIPPNPK